MMTAETTVSAADRRQATMRTGTRSRADHRPKAAVKALVLSAPRALALIAILAGLWLAPRLASSDPAGSWSASAPMVRVVSPDRDSVSAALQPPASLPPQAAVHSVRWRFTHPLDTPVRAQLCQLGRCIRLTTLRGQSAALAGNPADAPLYFHFRLGPSERRAVLVQGLQTIVNFQLPQS